MRCKEAEKPLRTHIENLDRQLIPDAWSYPRPGHSGVECPWCSTQQFPKGNKGDVVACHTCEGFMRLTITIEAQS